MKRVAVMLVTVDPTLGRALARRLPHGRFEVINIQPGVSVVDAVYRISPDIAVIDGIEERRDAVQMEVALLKKRQPQVRVIVVTGQSSAKDAVVIEQGIFFYLAGRCRGEQRFQRLLVRLITAAAESICRIPRTGQR